MASKSRRIQEPFGSATRLRERVQSLGLWGLDANWDDVQGEAWLELVIGLEERERAQRSLDRRVRAARIGKFKPMDQFEWNWPRKIDRQALEEIFRFDFVNEGMNVVLIGPNGVGKSMLAQNITHGAVMAGHTARFTLASEMLNDLAAQDGRNALRRRLAWFVRPALLAIDEVGYLSYGAQHADLMFDVVNRRVAAERATIVTTNKPFQGWNEVFPNSAAVVALIDRLLHRSEIIDIEADSYRFKEAQERSRERKRKRLHDKVGKGKEGDHEQ